MKQPSTGSGCLLHHLLRPRLAGDLRILQGHLQFWERGGNGENARGCGVAESCQGVLMPAAIQTCSVPSYYLFQKRAGSALTGLISRPCCGPVNFSEADLFLGSHNNLQDGQYRRNPRVWLLHALPCFKSAEGPYW